MMPHRGGTTAVSSQVFGRDGARPSSRVWLVTLAIFCGGTVLTVADNDLSRDTEYDYDPPAPGSYSLPVVKSAADGALLDSNNKAITLRDLTHGRITVLSFIYTRCAASKACPYATGVLSQIHDLSVDDKTLAKSMRLVSISFDPEYDTAQRLPAYSARIRLRVALCYIEIARGVRTYSRRLRSGCGQATKPGGSARSALSYPSGVFNRS